MDAWLCVCVNACVGSSPVHMRLTYSALYMQARKQNFLETDSFLLMMEVRALWTGEAGPAARRVSGHATPGKLGVIASFLAFSEVTEIELAMCLIKAGISQSQAN